MAMLTSEILADTPIGYWPLNEPGSTVATDLSGNGRPKVMG